MDKETLNVCINAIMTEIEIEAENIANTALKSAEGDLLANIENMAELSQSMNKKIQAIKDLLEIF